MKLALSEVDLMRLELRQRELAEDLRRRYPQELIIDPATSPGIRNDAQRQRRIADDYKATADILLGLQDRWGTMGPAVRAGYVSMSKGHDAAMKRAAEAPKKDEAAA